ncbi:hypothetical protein CL634_01960 [bacterium]|nr:hypothetical protein [bacterium]|tara:strand:+ start:117 stop:908 length:792 start_codon:yes stop_codon:yes gene_type:complete
MENFHVMTSAPNRELAETLPECWMPLEFQETRITFNDSPFEDRETLPDLPWEAYDREDALWASFWGHISRLPKLKAEIPDDFEIEVFQLTDQERTGNGLSFLDLRHEVSQDKLNERRFWWKSMWAEPRRMNGNCDVYLGDIHIVFYLPADYPRRLKLTFSDLMAVDFGTIRIVSDEVTNFGGFDPIHQTVRLVSQRASNRIGTHTARASPPFLIRAGPDPPGSISLLSHRLYGGLSPGAGKRVLVFPIPRGSARHIPRGILVL